MSTCEVSIIMPVKNTDVFLSTCLDSIIAQNFMRWELLAIDDHSTDSSLSILKYYAARDSRIRVYKNLGQGIIPALRTGLILASGYFITRMDSDDIMSSHKLDLMHTALVESGGGHLAIGLVKYFGDPHPAGAGYLKYASWLNDCTLNGTTFEQIYRECTVPSPCWMVYRNDLEQCGGFRSDLYPEDYDLAFRFRKEHLKMAPVREIIHWWRDYPERTSRTHPNYADNRFAELKITHFLQQDLQKSRPLVVWGAGGKGKQIARLLIEKGIEISWICNNRAKIGREIYGVILKDLSLLKNSANAQVIIAVSSPQSQQKIAWLKAEYNQHQYFHFC